MREVPVVRQLDRHWALAKHGWPGGTELPWPEGSQPSGSSYLSVEEALWAKHILLSQVLTAAGLGRESQKRDHPSNRHSSALLSRLHREWKGEPEWHTRLNNYCTKPARHCFLKLPLQLLNHQNCTLRTCCNLLSDLRWSGCVQGSTHSGTISVLPFFCSKKPKGNQTPWCLGKGIPDWDYPKAQTANSAVTPTIHVHSADVSVQARSWPFFFPFSSTHWFHFDSYHA